MSVWVDVREGPFVLVHQTTAGLGHGAEGSSGKGLPSAARDARTPASVPTLSGLGVRRHRGTPGLKYLYFPPPAPKWPWILVK